MMPFGNWWRIVIAALNHERKIRNWTSENTLAIGGQFYARSYRSFTKEERSALTNGHPLSVPSDWIICMPLKGTKRITVSKKEFQDRYNKWPAYRDRKIMRKDFNGSPYLISIFNAFNYLIALAIDDVEVKKLTDFSKQPK